MRILGGHDYYDTALAFGRDETLVFVRSPLEKARQVRESEAALRPVPERAITFGSSGFIRNTTHLHEDVEYTAYPRVVWFAGRRYGGMQVTRYGRGYKSGSMEDLWFWDSDRFAEFLVSIEACLKEPRKGRDPDASINTASVEAFFSDPGSEAEISWLISQRMSIAISESGRWTRSENACWKIDSDGLKDIHFQRCVTPYEAFQMLSQWVGGVLPRDGAEMVVIKDEKTMLSKHGMDKWSFKTLPSAR
ncbi:hypothetical protein D3C71_197510 [compost metagenome]